MITPQLDQPFPPDRPVLYDDQPPGPPFVNKPSNERDLDVLPKKTFTEPPPVPPDVPFPFQPVPDPLDPLETIFPRLLLDWLYTTIKPARGPE